MIEPSAPARSADPGAHGHFPKAVRKYLAGRAEPEATLVDAVPGRWAHALVVPARRETSAFLGGVEAAARAAPGRLLVVVVVNGVAGDAASAGANAELMADVRTVCRGIRPIAGAGASFTGELPAFDVLVIDRAGPGRELPARRGVGLARKIGTDGALALWAAGRLASPWIHCSDGDATQPADRLRLPDPTEADGVVAWTHPFVHESSGDDELDAALALYDEWLRYRVAGLRWAGSPWAFPTIGSTITVRADALAAVRGFPRREAAEDFYLLAKLAKVGRVAEAPTGPVRLRGRESDRVPFGTGAGVARIVAAHRRGEPDRLEDPALFVMLRHVQRALTRSDPFAPDARDGLDDVQRAAVASAWERLGARDAFSSLPPRARRDWLDAFRTLKFLHHLRDTGFPSVPREEALARARALGIRAE